MYNSSYDRERWLFNLAYLESIRVSELETVLAEIATEKPGRHIILEIGAGTGCQAQILFANGYAVEAIDTHDSNYAGNRIWPVSHYDGNHIPFPDNSFDLVFSSNVLEHIPHLREFQVEIKRVLKPDGIAIHVIPSGTWRLWTNVAHYAFILKVIMCILGGKLKFTAASQVCNSMETKISRHPKRGLVKRAIFASRHGVRGTAISEIYYFSRRGWHGMFERTGWKVKKYLPNRLFYTGYMILGPAMSLQHRRVLSYLFGSSSHIFLLTQGKGVDEQNP